MSVLTIGAFLTAWVIAGVALVRIVTDHARGDPAAHIDVGLLGLAGTWFARDVDQSGLAVATALVAGWHLGAHRMAQRFRAATTAARVYDHEDEPTERSEET